MRRTALKSICVEITTKTDQEPHIIAERRVNYYAGYFRENNEETHTREEFRALGIKNYLEDEDGDGVVNPAIVKIKVEGDGNEVN
mgnify:CR=1 FL=1